MSDRPKDHPSDDPGPLDVELGDLPPLDDGELEPATADELVTLIGVEEIEDDGAIGLEEFSTDAFAEELGDFEEAAQADDVDGVDAFASEAELDEEEGWADVGDPSAPLDDPWFDEEDGGDELEDDGGAEGPIGEADDAFQDEDQEPDAQYLGPVRGRITGVAVVDGALLAAGDGLYRAGADGLLHRYDSEDEIDAVSVYAAGAAVFLGTERRGLLRAEGFDRAPTPFGVWLDPRCQTGRGLSGAFTVFGERLEDRLRLTGITGERELLASEDGGNTWRGPLTERPCLAAAPWEGEASVLALVDEEGGPSLLRSDGQWAWRRVEAPCPIKSADRAAKISIAAAGGVIAVGSDRLGAPLYVSLDRGGRFAEILAVTGVTAIAVDAHEPGWIAAATWDPEEGTGAVRVSRDGGKTWRTAFETGRADEREEPVYRPGRVTWLAVVGDSCRRLVAVTGEGAYSAPLPGDAAKH